MNPYGARNVSGFENGTVIASCDELCTHHPAWGKCQTRDFFYEIRCEKISSLEKTKSIEVPVDARIASEFIDSKLIQAIRRFGQDQEPELVSFRQWCSDWSWAKRSDVYTHQIHSYPAKLLAYIPIVFLSSSIANANDIVLDSFAGTSTVGLECLTHDFSPRNYYGVEINPLARLIGKVKTKPLSAIV